MFHDAVAYKCSHVGGLKEPSLYLNDDLPETASTNGLDLELPAHFMLDYLEACLPAPIVI